MATDSPKPAAGDGNFLLPDGRSLCYAEYGDQAGYPVFFFHGAPGSRRQVHADMVAVARRLGARVIVPERPGYGGSSEQPGRSLQNWSQDVRALGQALGLGRFAIAGFSVGGTHALACAHDMPQSIDRVAVAGGLGPLDGPQAMDGMSAQVTGLFTLAQSDPVGLKNALLPLAASPAAALEAMGASMPASDQAVLRERAAAYLADVTESLRQGVEGVVSDFLIASRPWGFSPADIGIEVDWWHGAQDCNAPPAMAHRLAAELPRARLRMFPEEGHLGFMAHWEEMLRGLLPR